MTEFAKQGLQYNKAIKTIADALDECIGGIPDSGAVAAHVIARLGRLDPPILLCTPDDLKDG